MSICLWGDLAQSTSFIHILAPHKYLLPCCCAYTAKNLRNPSFSSLHDQDRVIYIVDSPTPVPSLSLIWSWIFTVILASTLFLLSLLRLLSKSNYNRHKLPPGPIKLPFIGNLHKIFGDLQHRSLHKLSQKHGPLMYLKLGIIPTVVASSADLAKEFMKTHDLECCSRPLHTSLGKLSYGFSDIGFTPYGDQWRELRKICILKLFSPKKVALCQYIREEEVDKMINSISSTSRYSEINLSEELLSLAINITCRALLGIRHYNVKRLHRILNEAQAMISGFFVADYIPILGWLDVFTGMRSRLDKNFHVLDEFYQEVIDQHVDSKMRHEDVVDALLQMQRKETHITEHHIKGVLMNMIVAGSDTSSAAVEWAMTELMRNPESMKKAQQEVRSLIGHKPKVEETDLDQLLYLKSVVKETMRLHPPAPLLIARETMQHCKINGYDIPAKTLLLINAFTVGRDAYMWEKPNEFRPERFINSSIDYKGRDFQLIPFGAGRRICPGMNAGALVVELALANLLYLFDWKLPKGMTKEDIDMGESPGVTVHRKFDLQLVAVKYAGAN